MKASFFCVALIVSLILIFSISGCGENSDELAPEPPSASIICPADGTNVFGTVGITVDAIDDSAVSTIELFVNGEPVTILSISPYEYDWDTTGLDDGSIHTIYARVIDDEGQVSGTEVINVCICDCGITGNTYTNWKYGFQISAPSSEWDIHGSEALGSDSGNLVIISSGLYGVSAAAVSVTAEAFSGDLSRYQTLVEEQFGTGVIVATEDITIDGVPARDMHIKEEPYDWYLWPLIEGKVVYFIKGKTAYTIIAFAYDSIYPVYEEEFDEIVNSFEFL